MQHAWSGTDGLPSTGAIRVAVDRISHSKLFSKCPQLVRLFEFCVGRTLEGQATCLKEIVLGIEVFDRGANFDPRIDPIVRVDFRRLRRKLDQYYGSEGEGERLRIVFDPGSYVPQFVESVFAAPCRAWPPMSRIAVLPLQNLSREVDGSELASGLTDDLISALSRIAGLQVVARTSVFLFEKEYGDIREAGELLDVGTVLEGGVQCHGDRLRVNVRLVATETGFAFWSNNFNGSFGAVFDMQDEIVLSVCEELRVRAAHGAVRRARSTEAYRYYLKGRHLYSGRQPDLLLRALGSFDAALALDPDYAPAHAGLADCYTLLSVFSIPPRQALAKAKQEALRAVELDPELAEGHSALGAVLTGYDRDFTAAGKAFERAVRLSPGTAGTYDWYTFYLAAVGREDEAIKYIRYAQHLDPLSPFVNANVGLMLYLARRYEEAIAHFEDALDDDPHFCWTHWHLGMAYLASDAVDRATDAFQRAADLSGGSPPMAATLALACGLGGRRTESEAIVAELDRRSRSQYICPVPMALGYAGLGDKETAFHLMGQALEERCPLVLWFTWPIFDILREDVRFQAVLDRIGLSRA